MTKQIPLSGRRGQGKFALVDDQDFELLLPYRWRLNSKGYAIRSYSVGGNFRPGGLLGDLELPDLSLAGLLYDTSLFSGYGIVVVVPEPSRALLLLLGLVGLLLRRRR